MFEIPWGWVCSLMIRFLGNLVLLPPKVFNPKRPSCLYSSLFLERSSELLSGKQVTGCGVYCILDLLTKSSAWDFWLLLQCNGTLLLSDVIPGYLWHQLIPPVLWPVLLTCVMHCLSSTSAPCKSSRVNSPSSFPLFLPEFACCFEISFVVHAKENQ